MIKLKKLILESEYLNRGAFVIDSNGKIHDVPYHGDILLKSEFKSLLEKALKQFSTIKNIKYLSKSGNSNLLKVLDNAGFLRGGVFSSSKRELYFIINKNKLSDKAKLGAIKKIAEYRPSRIFVEDLSSGKSFYMEPDEFAGEYL